jgi:preprotein translocase subunit YajC
LSLAFAYQEVPPRRATPSPAAPKQAANRATETAAAQEGASPDGAAPPGGSFGMMFPILLLLPLILVLLWSSRSQQKRQQAAIAALKKGDRVLTQSGLVGKLVDLGERYAKVEVAPGVKVEVLRTGLLGKDTGDNTIDPKR